MERTYEVVIVGGGFAGVACAKELGRKGVSVLLIDQNNYHQFQPLLYQVSTAQIGITDVTRPLRGIFRRVKHVRVITAVATSVDVASHTVTTGDGNTYRGEVLVLATGAVPNFFNTPGAEEHAFPLYSATDATRLGTRLVELLDENDSVPEPDQGVNVVVVGGGPTGVETAGAIAEMMRYVVPQYFSKAMAARSSVHLVDMVPVVLNMFSEKSQRYAKSRLEKVGVKIKLGSGVTEVGEDAVTLADGTTIPSRLVIWAGGLKGAPLIAESGLPLGRGGRVDTNPDLTAPEAEGVYVLGDAANTTDRTGASLPQLGSVAQQSGKWAARNIHADLRGGTREQFKYVDKGYMAMVGRGAAVAELGKRRTQLQGPFAFLAWLAVHVVLLSGNRQRMRALFSWFENYLSHTRSHVALGQAKAGAAGRD